MNDFEKLLQNQAPRPVPAHWRAQILSHAGESSLVPRNRAALWPSPMAWGALAALWMVLLGLHAATREPASAASHASRARFNGLDPVLRASSAWLVANQMDRAAY